MGPDDAPQFCGHGEGDEEIGNRQQQARLLARQPVVSVGAAALRTVTVVAGMIAVMKAGTVRALEQSAAQRRSAAGQDLFQDLAMPSGHGRAEPLRVSRSQLAEQLLDCEASTSTAGGGVHLESAHEVIESLLMLGFAEARQVRVNCGDDRTAVAKVDLDLAQVLALFQQMRGVGVTQGVDVGFFADAAGFKGEAEGALQGGATHGNGRGAGTEATLAFGRKEESGMTMTLPLLAQEMEGASGQRDIAILVAFAFANVEEHSFRINVPDLQSQTFSQPQAARVNGGETNAMIEGGNKGDDAPDFIRRENDREFEPGIGAGQFQFVRPNAFKRFLPEDFDRADGLGAGLARDFLFGLKVDAILANLFGRDQVRGFIVELTLVDAGRRSKPVPCEGRWGEVLNHRQRI
jgi:hypothetical protein